jgi:hypothetical protein
MEQIKKNMGQQKTFVVPFYYMHLQTTMSNTLNNMIAARSYGKIKIKSLIANWLQVGNTTNNVQGVYGGALSGSGCTLSSVVLMLSSANFWTNGSPIGEIADVTTGTSWQTGQHMEFYQPGTYHWDGFFSNDGFSLAINTTNNSTETISYYVSGSIEFEPIKD